MKCAKKFCVGLCNASFKDVFLPGGGCISL